MNFTLVVRDINISIWAHLQFGRFKLLNTKILKYISRVEFWNFLSCTCFKDYGNLMHEFFKRTEGRDTLLFSYFFQINFLKLCFKITTGRNFIYLFMILLLISTWLNFSIIACNKRACRNFLLNSKEFSGHNKLRNVVARFCKPSVRVIKWSRANYE